MKIHISNFVRRQTENSEYSHWNISDEELLARVNSCFHLAKQGYREGVLLVPVDPEGFFSSVVELKEGDKLVGDYLPRVNGEEPRKGLRVVANQFGEKLYKSPAKRVDIVLYSHEVLAENKENDTDADFEIISVNANCVDEEMPIPVDALIYNHFELNGGTSTRMTDSEFVKLLRQSVIYWKNKALIGK